MTRTEVFDFIDKYYNDAEQKIARGLVLSVKTEIEPLILLIIERSEASKGVLTVLITSLVYKLLNPSQDIRRHQTSISNGYSGRTFDSQYITPYLKYRRFPSMAESGWLTRSLEQKVPYDKNYTGAIKPQALKQAFLELIDYIEHEDKASLESLLTYILGALLKQREKNQILLATPGNLSIGQTLCLLERHFNATYKYEGASRLPTLAIYSVYEVLIKELKRFEDKILLPLESHTSSDKQSGRLGDIDLVYQNGGNAFEVVEVKHQIPITLDIVERAFEKIVSSSVERYYILSTAPISIEEQQKIELRQLEIKNIHGCHLIANGIYTTLLYYLRLLDKPSSFIARYTDNLSKDKSIKYEHRQKWNELVQELLGGG